MPGDPFDLVDMKFQEVNDTLLRLGRVFIRPEHKGQLTSHMAAQMSIPNTILHHNWHDPFKTLLRAFLAETRSIPDIIQTRFGWDRVREARLRLLDPAEQTRRQDFRDQFQPHFDAFNHQALSDQRRKCIHFDGQVDWHVELRGFRGGTYFGDSENPLAQAEELTYSGNPALDVAIMSSPALHLQPRAENFWLGKVGDPDRTPLFDECRSYLREAEKLIQTARSLFAAIHNGHPLTVPTW
jgi:hypothetical protein